MFWDSIFHPEPVTENGSWIPPSPSKGNSKAAALFGCMVSCFFLTRLMSLSNSFSRCHFLHLSSSPCRLQTMTLTSLPKAGEQAIYYKPQIKLPAVAKLFSWGWRETIAEPGQLHKCRRHISSVPGTSLTVSHPGQEFSRWLLNKLISTLLTPNGK